MAFGITLSFDKRSQLCLIQMDSAVKRTEESLEKIGSVKYLLFFKHN